MSATFDQEDGVTEHHRGMSPGMGANPIAQRRATSVRGVKGHGNVA